MAASSSKLRSFYDIPMKTGLLPGILDLILEGGPRYLHAYFDKRHKELGPIFREKIGTYELVSVADTSMIRTTIRNEGRYPKTKLPPAWEIYNEANDIKRGLFFESGQTWLKMRNSVNRTLLNSDSVNIHTEKVLSLTEALIDSWQVYDGILHLDQISRGLNKWSVESIALMIFGRRLSDIDVSIVDSLVDHAIKMFSLTSKLQVIPPELAKKLNLKIWREFSSTSDALLFDAKYCVDLLLKESTTGKDQIGMIWDIISQNSLNQDEISRIFVDFLIAAADTTAAALHWSLYLLAENPSLQERVFNEIDPLSSKSQISQLCDRAQYLNGFIRETLRLYPPAPFISRILEQDIVLGDYLVNGGKQIVFPLYTTGRMEEYFYKPLEVIPERWMRKNSESNDQTEHHICKHDPMGSLPFGLGSKMCIGRKMASLELIVFITSFVERFKFELIDSQKVNIRLNLTTWPDKPIKLKVERRH